MTALDELEMVAGELQRIDAEAKRLRDELYGRVRALYDEGERPIVIAHAAGITKQRVNQIVNRDREAASAEV